MRFEEALKQILCNKEGIDYNKYLKGTDYNIVFEKMEHYSNSDCCTKMEVGIFFENTKYAYLLGSLFLGDSYNPKNFVDENEIHYFVSNKQYQFSKEEVEIKEIVERYDPACGKSLKEWCDEE